MDIQIIKVRVLIMTVVFLAIALSYTTIRTNYAVDQVMYLSTQMDHVSSLLNEQVEINDQVSTDIQELMER